MGGRLLASMSLAVLALAQQPPGVPENAVQRVSDHVYAIIGFPNIAIVEGSRGTLVVDTGMGPKNGGVIVRAVGKLAKTPNLYLTTTHFHPEHASGVQAFPESTVLIRPAVQQEEMERRGQEFLEFFRGLSAQFKEELKDVQMRKPDILFDRELRLDLGGVTTRLSWMGAAHTKGDELIWVEGDRTLISGDIVQNKLVPNMPNEDASVKGWIEVLDKLAQAPVQPRFIVPDHGALGDGALIAQQRAFLADAQSRALALKRQGTGVEDAAKMMTAEFKTKYADWQNMNPLANIVRRVYAESQ
ncbi:MAG: hypothetical protein C5B51_00065 [Terriglobia bacterium]|nr:MAG: hypothetical protein C5B51_00065 [Terriglobia bacterium]